MHDAPGSCNRSGTWQCTQFCTTHLDRATDQAHCTPDSFYITHRDHVTSQAHCRASCKGKDLLGLRRECQRDTHRASNEHERLRDLQKCVRAHVRTCAGVLVGGRMRACVHGWVGELSGRVHARPAWTSAMSKARPIESTHVSPNSKGCRWPDQQHIHRCSQRVVCGHHSAAQVDDECRIQNQGRTRVLHGMWHAQ